MGKMDVAGKNYDLMMPPQGAVLNDRQIAGILTFVREMNGLAKRDATVDPNTVAKWRAKYKDKETYWKTDELLRDHPLPLEGGLLEKLIRECLHREYKQIQILPSSNQQNRKATGWCGFLAGIQREEHFPGVGRKFKN